MKQVLTLCFSLFIYGFLHGQSAPNFFQFVDHSAIVLSADSDTYALPGEHKALQLDYVAMREYLQTAPLSHPGFEMEDAISLVLPLSDGTSESFLVWESPVVDDKLYEKYPEIRTYAGVGIDDPTKTIRLGYGYDGFHAVVLGENKSTAITQYASDQTEYYLCFSPKEFQESLPFGADHQCGVDETAPQADPAQFPPEPVLNMRGGGEGSLVERHVFRVALACTGEYASSHGGTVESVMSSFVTAIDALNIITERDAGVHMILVAASENLIFLDPNSDPYPVGNEGGLLIQINTEIMNNVIGLGSYDVGQVFTGPCTDVGGVVSGANTCSGGKGAGTTCHFSSNVVATMLGTGSHEFGHQLGAGHTWNHCPGNEGQHSSSSAWEPGSGSTILSYQGACAPSNISGNDNVFYHSGTTGQIWNFTRTGGGAQCGQIITTSNHSPVVELPYADGFYIPIRTPFELEATASDEDGDEIIYAWEQYNLGPYTPLGTQNGTSPLFRVFNPSSTAKRVFPRLQTILNNASDPEELLPNQTRNMTFRCLVKDNNLTEMAAGLTWADVSFEATASAGPFRVTYPNDNGIVWKAGEKVEVTWDVANTDNDLVKCYAVNILLSTDGGLNFDHLIVGATPNDGAEIITVPDLVSDDVRVRIEASENIFFDLSNRDLEIQPADEPTYAMLIQPQWQQVCVPGNGMLDIAIADIAGYDQPVELAITGGLPVDVDVSFSQNPVMPGETTTLIVDMESVTADGLFEAELRAISNGDTLYNALTFNVVYNDFTDLKLNGPIDGISNQDLLGEFEWTTVPNADLYEFQIATSPTFEESTIVDEAFGLTGGNFTSPVALEPSTVYYWRVRPSNECGNAEYTSPAVFQTFFSSCDVFESADVPIVISALGLPTIESILSVSQSGEISDLNVSRLKGFHNGIQDIKTTLISPAGTELVLFDNLDGCGNSSEFNFGLDDESPFPIECPPLDGLKYIPENPLTTFDGENTLGNWIMRIQVIDDFGDGGQLLEWALEFCANVDAEHPFLVENDTIYVQPLDTRPIHNFDLFASDPDNPGAELVFTIVDETDHGFLTKNGNPIGAGGTFNLVDLNAQNIQYTNTNGDEDYDFFTFTVTDGAGGLLGTPRFNIVIDEEAVVDVDEKLTTNDVLLFPNPATSTLNVVFQEVLDSDAVLNISDMQGRVVEQRDLPQANQQVQFNLDNFADGIYFFTVRTASSVFSKKFIVQR